MLLVQKPYSYIHEANKLLTHSIQEFKIIKTFKLHVLTRFNVNVYFRIKPLVAKAFVFNKKLSTCHVWIFHHFLQVVGINHVPIAF